jgi:hypothetical protein
MQKVILTTMVLMLLSSVGYSADWKYIFTAPTGGEWFYDTQSITHGEDTTLVWTKWILSDKERAKFIKEFPEKFTIKESKVVNRVEGEYTATSGGEKIITTSKYIIEISFFIQKEEINCSKNVARIMSMSLYDSGGALVWFSGDHKQNQFEDVFPDSKGVTLIESICK